MKSDRNILPISLLIIAIIGILLIIMSAVWHMIVLVDISYILWAVILLLAIIVFVFKKKFWWGKP